MEKKLDEKVAKHVFWKREITKIRLTHHYVRSSLELG